MKQTVLDASALISFFENRTGGDRVEELISESPIGKAELLMSVVNWGEVYYSAWHAHGENAARQMAAEISQIPIHLLNADLDLTKCAAKLRGRYRLPYANCFAAAVSKIRKAHLVTSDRDFVKVRPEIEIEFL